MPTFLETLGERHRVAEQTQLLQLQREERVLAHLRARAQGQQLLEDAWASSDPYASNGGSVAGLGSAANDLFHPSALGFHSARPGSRQHGGLPPYYRTEMQHWQLVDAARILEAMCPTAVCILDVLTQFCIFTGFTFKIVRKKKPGDAAHAIDKSPASPDGEPKPASDPLVDKAQQVIDKWQRDVDWPAWQPELFRRTRRDGEAFLVLEPDEAAGGTLGLRSVEPEQVKEPQGVAPQINRELGISGRDASWRFGILTSKENTSIPIKYNVVSQYNDTTKQHTVYDADEVFHLKTEWIDRQAKRGISDFFSVANDLPGVKKLLRYLREGATVQASIAWVREHPEGMDPVGLAGAGGLTTTRTGQQMPATVFDQVRMLDVSAGMKYTAGPLGVSGKNSALILVLQAVLRNIGARWQMPEGIVSGDASNANMASALVAEAPFVRGCEARQWFYRNGYKQLVERVLDHAAVTGLLGGARENILDDLEVSVEMPPVVPRKAKEETERNALLNERGILSNQTWSSREDLDFEDEQANIEEDPIEPPSIMLGMAEGEPQDDTAKEGNPEPESERATS
ncbi:MAG: phage portal protein [Planctomycetes bacterium]|nr:phage portal protein [Planctomycetota bacterium]